MACCEQAFVVEKRTNEVLDIGVDWSDTMRRLRESTISSVDWYVDPSMPGNATIAEAPYQPRLVGHEALARITTGNTSDTLLCCKATFGSGQVEIDKTLVKWIP